MLLVVPAAAQGILMWIGALCVELFVSAEMIDTRYAGRALKARRKLLYASSAGSCALLLWMVSFFNWHLPFYDNYGVMISRLIEVCASGTRTPRHCALSCGETKR